MLVWHNVCIFANKNRNMKSVDSPHLCKWTRVICNNLFNNGTWKIIDTNKFIKKGLSINRRSSKVFTDNNRIKNEI